MKKLLVLAGAVMLSYATASAQMFDPHFGLGVGVGSTGIAIDASGTFNNYLGARIGVDIVPKIKVGTELDLKTDGMNKKVSELTTEINKLNIELAKYGQPQVDLSQFPSGNLPNKMDVEGKLNNTTFHFLVDVYPFGEKSSFHVTAGAYFGPSDVVSVYNKEDGFLRPITAYNDALLYAQAQPTTNTVRQVIDQYGLKMIGAELGDYFVTPNPAENGNVEATIEVKKFRPYLGIGFGRAVPKNSTLACQFDLGVQFWGTPKVYAPTYDNIAGTYQREQLKEGNAGGDAGGVLKTISKVSVYPVLNIRLVGKLF